MEQNNENTGNESWEGRFTQLQHQNKQQNDRLKRFSETVESKFPMLMKTLERFEKRKYDEQEHVLLQRPEKRPELLLRARNAESKRQLRTHRQSNQIRGNQIIK